MPELFMFFTIFAKLRAKLAQNTPQSLLHDARSHKKYDNTILATPLLHEK